MTSFLKFLKKPIIIFPFILGLISLYYSYPDILFKRPQSVHKWRQSDCASVTLNYYQTGMHFFKPQTHNLTSDNCTSGYNATSEIPFFYYFIAILYKIFGPHEFIYRFVNTLLFFIGLTYLFKSYSIILKNSFIAITATLYFFASPVLVYYGNNYLTDSTAFSLAFIALYHFIAFYKMKGSKHFYFSVLFFFLAGSCKITSLLSFVAILSIIFIDLIGITKNKIKELFIEHKVGFCISIFLLGLVIGSWVLFAKQYNSIHNSGYFSTTIFPIWDLNKLEIHAVFDAMWNGWLSQYYHPSFLLIFGIILFFNLFFYKTEEKVLYLLHLFLFIGVIIYSILWFITYKNHDYYLLNLYILPAISFLLFLSNLKQLFPNIYTSKILKIVVVLYLLFNIYHTSNVLKIRYNGWQSDPESYSFHSVTPYLHTIGINDLDTVICLPDYTHASLYNMNLRGWTNCCGISGDSISFERNIRNGAKYLIVNDDISKNFPFAIKYMKNKIGEYQNIKIFRIRE